MAFTVRSPHGEEASQVIKDFSGLLYGVVLVVFPVEPKACAVFELTGGMSGKD